MPLRAARRHLQRWAALDVADLIAPVPKALLGHQPRHPYLLVEIQAEDPARLPPDNVLAMIARFEQAPSAKALEELVHSLPDWLARIDDPGLAESFADWIRHLVAEPIDKSGNEVQRQPTKEGVAELTTLFDRVQQWGKERDREWLQKGIERGRTEGERALARRLVGDRFGPRAAQELSRVLDERPEAAEVPGIVTLIFACETAEEFLKARAGSLTGRRSAWTSTPGGGWRLADFTPPGSRRLLVVPEFGKDETLWPLIPMVPSGS